MTDWHSHILPGMDDGSHDVAESVSMVAMQMQQGVDTVIATPHFYANDESADLFLSRRRCSYEKLIAELPDGAPEIRLGAEVSYYQGISRMEGLNDLRIEGTKLILLEMPLATWAESVVRELIELSGRSKFEIILAHVERYMGFQKQSVFDRLHESGILMQVNAGSFTKFGSRHNVISLLKKGEIQFIGSDCRNMTSRPPQMDRAFEMIRKKLGDEFIEQMNEYGLSLLGSIKIS